MNINLSKLLSQFLMFAIIQSSCPTHDHPFFRAMIPLNKDFVDSYVHNKSIIEVPIDYAQYCHILQNDFNQRIAKLKKAQKSKSKIDKKTIETKPESIDIKPYYKYAIKLCLNEAEFNCESLYKFLNKTTDIDAKVPFNPWLKDIIKATTSLILKIEHDKELYILKIPLSYIDYTEYASKEVDMNILDALEEKLDKSEQSILLEVDIVNTLRNNNYNNVFFIEHVISKKMGILKIWLLCDTADRRYTIISPM